MLSCYCGCQDWSSGLPAPCFLRPGEVVPGLPSVSLSYTVSLVCLYRLYHQRALLARVAFHGLCSILWSSPVKYKGQYLNQAGWRQIFIKHQYMFNTLPLALEAWRNIKNVSFHEDFTIWDEETTESVKHQWSISWWKPPHFIGCSLCSHCSLDNRLNSHDEPLW